MGPATNRSLCVLCVGNQISTNGECEPCEQNSVANAEKT
eukprot:COSAG03_NODE_18040_length_363_cov_0.776515_1_plen_38_part_01